MEVGNYDIAILSIEQSRPIYTGGVKLWSSDEEGSMDGVYKG